MTKTRQLKQKDLLIITRATYQIWKQTYKNQRRNFAEGNATLGSYHGPAHDSALMKMRIINLFPACPGPSY